MLRDWRDNKLGLVVGVLLVGLGILLCVAALIGLAVLLDLIAEVVR